MQKTNFNREIALALWVIGGFAMASQYNSCAPVSFEQSSQSKAVDAQSISLVLINRDAPYTNSDLVEVNLSSDLADEVYVTNDKTCETGGAWEPLTSTKPWTLSAKNQMTSVYAKFRNASEGVSSDCLTDEILHDDIPPNVILQKPSLITNIQTPIIMFLASDSGSGLDRMTCQWPGEVA
ncbi:MAG: hypothetical protein AB7F86_11525, partial [Bdellovibrionales bacterium]